MAAPHISAALRPLVRERAGQCCEYCLVPEALTYAAHEVDHVVAVKHLGPTDAGNLALACPECNAHKGTDLASVDQSTGELVRLFHPPTDHWSDHFQIEGALVTPLTSVGRVTVRLLQLNTDERVAERELHLRTGLLGPDADLDGLV